MQCTVCFEPYDICDRRPKIVPCGHTFCLKCIKSFRSYNCATCRMAFPGEPDQLIDNFLALEETADMKTIRRIFWCETCDAAPRTDCMENHELISSRTAQGRLEGAFAAAILAEEAVLARERELHERMHRLSLVAVEAMDADTARFTDTLREMRLKGILGVAGDNPNFASSSAGVKAVKMVISAAEARTAAARDTLAIADATEAMLQVKCGSRSRCFSVDLVAAAAAAAAADADPAAEDESAVPADTARLVMFCAYMLERLAMPGVTCRLAYHLTASVTTARGVALPDITIEFDELPSRDRLQEHWSKGWRLYSICKSCLESCHSQDFTPQPPGSETNSVEKGAVCLGRSSGRYYFILCDDMSSRFLLSLTASFKVVGRVTRNLSSLQEAVKNTNAPDIVKIVPKPS